MSEDRRGGQAAVLQLVDAHRKDAEHGHRRLRDDWRGHEARLDSLEAFQQETEVHLVRLDNSPAPDVSKLKFPLQTVVLIVSICFGMWATTYGLRSDVRDILTQMAAKKDNDAIKETLQNERAAALRAAIDGTEKQLKLQQIQIQELTNAVLDLKRSQR